ncbi:hypothetical protein ACEPAF_5366 [Sanghuangporus sanghuang]
MAGTHHDPSVSVALIAIFLFSLRRMACEPGVVERLAVSSLHFLIVITRQGRCLILRPQIEDGISTLTEVLPKEPKRPIPGTHTWVIGSPNASSDGSDRSKRKGFRGKQSSTRHGKPSSSRGKKINIGKQGDPSQALVIPVAVVGADASASDPNRTAQTLAMSCNVHQSFGQAVNHMMDSNLSAGFLSTTSLGITREVHEGFAMPAEQSMLTDENALHLRLFPPQFPDENGGNIHNSANGTLPLSLSHSNRNQSTISTEQGQYSVYGTSRRLLQCSHSFELDFVFRCRTCGECIPMDEEQPAIAHNHAVHTSQNDDPYLTGGLRSTTNDQGTSLANESSSRIGSSGDVVPNITILSPEERPTEPIPMLDTYAMNQRSQMNELPPLLIPAYCHLGEPPSSIPGSASSSGSSELFATPESATSHSFPSPYSDVTSINDSLHAYHMYPKV